MQDEYSTPIEQIRPDIKPEQQQSINYSDLLQTMEHQQQHNQQYVMSEQQPDYPPHPIVQSRLPMQANMNQNFIQEQKHYEKPADTNNMSQIQKDIMYILIPSIVLYSVPFQNHMLRIIPSLFKDDRPTIIGNVVNGCLIALVFTALKNMKINFS
jgi:hypothetical protein